VQTLHRWLKVSDTASGSAYVIQAGRRQVNGLICPRWKYKMGEVFCVHVRKTVYATDEEQWQPKGKSQPHARTQRPVVSRICSLLR